MLVLTWDMRSLEGHQQIYAYLTSTLAPARISHFSLADGPGSRPDITSDGGIGAGFTFDMPARRGRGYFILLQDKDGSKTWKALSVFMTVDAIKGYEEIGAELGTYEGHMRSWEDVHSERRARIERDPYVIIMGAGQSGLMAAARFNQMSISALVVEKKQRVGDQWRERYPTLSLHSIRNHHTMLYQQFPRNWPVFTPRDKMADWLEQYAVSQDLVVWTNSYVMPGAIYDPDRKRWTIVVCRNDMLVRLYPAHIVSAIGSTGIPRTHHPPGRDIFLGKTMHSGHYPGGRHYAGMHAIVVGACQSAADISQDLVANGAASVTMVQRSTTCVVSRNTGAEDFSMFWPDEESIEEHDFRFNAVPIGLKRIIAKAREPVSWDRDKALYSKLKHSGLKLNMGSDGSGYMILAYERFGGYWFDVGLADLIESGKVEVKHGVEIKEFTETDVIFTDGSGLPADLVVFATGWGDPREPLKEIFGSDVINQTKKVWGLDSEGEITGCCRPTGHTALWYIAGDFSIARFYSKHLSSEKWGML
ncbi:FAD/NAD(P)-binding domain-containing protein [Wolfiporia cocos MD-104 SS10]|uniref:FAD/NAD(P)-binding domain-containing protein n=1 Tax=Wolfiporia cocos (strain MD-104) TaxID=742152 RepID=A0A2H3J865_WOLCO|nr:FAD/NAD(P)-binding domain-containing protein [Wolfiporia cocos MD-104 SS10]